MYSRGVIIDNFRAFRHAELSLPEEGLVLIAGANSAGKSALLSAIDVVGGHSGDTTSLRHVGGNLPAMVTAQFGVSEAERARLLEKTPAREQLLADGALECLQFLFAESEVLRQYGDAGLGLVEIRGDWPGIGVQPLARVDLSSHTPTVLTLAALTQDVQPGGMSGRGVPSNPARLDRLLRSTPDGQPFEALLSAWRSRFYHFQALRPGTLRTQSLASSNRLDPSGSDLAAVLLYLATDRPALFARLRALVGEVVPHIGRLEVRTGGGELRVVFDSVSGDLNLKDLGTGVEQLLMTLVVGLMEDPPFTLVVEEPETNLHPSGQRTLLGHFQKWAEDRQIIAATHSPVMLNWSPGGDRLWHVTRSGSESSVTIVDADPLPLLNSLGVQLSDV